MKYIGLISFILLLLLAFSCSQGEGGQPFREFFSKQKEGQSEKAAQTTAASADTVALHLHQQNSSLRKENARLQSEGLQLRQELLQERAARLAGQRDSLNAQLVHIQAALEMISDDSLFTIQARDSLLQKQRFTQQMDKKIQERLVANSKVVDLQLGKLEEQKRSIQQQMDMEQRQVQIGEKKIAVLKEEQDLYESQQQKLWVDEAPQSKIAEAAAAIAAADKSVEAEKEKIKAAGANIDGWQETIAGIDVQREALNARIRKNYTAKEVLEETIAAEQELLTRELARLDSAWQSRQAERPALLQKQEESEALLDSLEQQTAELLEVPVPLSDTLATGTARAASADVQDQLVADTPVVAARNSLPIQEEQVDPRESEKNRQFYLRFLALFGALLFLLLGFYFLRRRRRKAKP